MYGLEALSLGKDFDREGRRWTALDGVAFALSPGESLAVVGESGCGKTTLLRVLGGLLDPDRGSVRLIDDQGRATVPGQARVMTMFQEPRLLPWLTVRDNLALASRGPLWPHSREPSAVAALVDAQLEMLGLGGWGGARADQLSGGMAQRVALGRTLVPDPGLILMDEPFAALDSLTRRRLQDELASLLTHQRRTLVLVTHDLDEAFFLADRIAVLRQGRLVSLIDNPRKGIRKEQEDPAIRALLNDLGGSV